MRGKGLTECSGGGACGITPAYAGKSAPETVYHIKEKGSPPPMRGKDLRANQKDRRSRITPAYAGKSLPV